MASLAGFDASQHAEQVSYAPLPAGQYVVIATASEMKPTKTGTGQFLQFTFEVLDGPSKGRRLWTRLNLINPNQTAVDIANRELAAICRAVGIIKPQDSAELHNKPILVTVDVELDRNGKEGNRITQYDPIGGGAPAAPAFAQAPAAPAAAAPWGGAAPAAPAAAGAAPWAK